MDMNEAFKMALRNATKLPSFSTADDEPEIINGANVREVAETCVDLSVAYSPVIEWPGASPIEVESTRGGTVYRLMRSNSNFTNVKPAELKVMRARYLLTRGAKYKELVEGKGFDSEAKALFPEGVFLPKLISSDSAVAE